MYQTLLLQPIDASISHLTSLLTVAYFCYGLYFSFHCIEHYCCHSLLQPFIFLLCHSQLTILHHQTRSRKDMDYHNNQHAVVYHQRLPPYFPSPHTTPIPSSLSPSLPSFPRLAHYFTVYYYYLLFIFTLLFSPDWTAIITICCTHI